MCLLTGSAFTTPCAGVADAQSSLIRPESPGSEESHAQSLGSRAHVSCVNLGA